MTPTNQDSDFVLKRAVEVGVIGNYRDEVPEGFTSEEATSLTTLPAGTPMKDIPETQLKQLAPAHFEAEDGSLPSDWRSDEQITNDLAQEEARADLRQAMDEARQDGVPFVHDEYLASIDADVGTPPEETPDEEEEA